MVFSGPGPSQDLATWAGDRPLVLVTDSSEAFPRAWDVVPRARVQGLLGTTLPLVALDLTTAVTPSLVATVSGLVPAGGALVLLLPDLDHPDTWPDGFAERLSVWPYGPEDAGSRFRERLVRSLREAPRGLVELHRPGGGLPPPPAAVASGRAGLPRPEAITPEGLAAITASRDQALALEALSAMLRTTASVAVMVADRGRGKSAALGMLAALAVTAGLEVGLTGPTRPSEVLRWAEWLLGGPGPTYLPPGDAAARTWDLLLVDEAAGIPVWMLGRLLEASPRVAFATTVHGYEGTGRGFDLRFMARLAREPRPLRRVRLLEPIRWAPGDPLEAWIRELLLLDSPLQGGSLPESPPAPGAGHRKTTLRWVERDDLAQDEGLLSKVMGLLTMAHYRTTPDDLARILDAPNLDTMVAEARGMVVGVCLVAREGGLPEHLLSELYLGRSRLRGHMLPEILVSHLGVERAGALDMARVVRIAVHPDFRRQGVGTELLEELCAGRWDLVGTGFAATGDLIPFWTSAGFAPVRLGVTRSRISGEPSLVMLRGISGAGRDLVRDLAARFGVSTPWILSDALRDLDPDTGLVVLGATAWWTPPRLDRAAWEDLAATAFGHRLYDVNPGPVFELVRAYLTDPDPDPELDHATRILLLTKVVQRRTWPQVAGGDDRASLHRAMRRFRAGLAALVRSYGPGWLAPVMERFEAARRGVKGPGRAREGSR